MAGTLQKVKRTGRRDSDLLACVIAVNQLISDFDAHTHSGVTVGAGTSGAPSAVTSAGKIADLSGNILTQNV
jgi:hypothetical protein